MKQVDKEHYQFKDYMTKKRWSSVWHQLDEIIGLCPNSVLEIGPGLGIFKSVAASLGINVETLDIDPQLSPDYVASAESLPFHDNYFDVVCGFQVLEHFPYDKSIRVYEEMVRVAKKYIIVSLPDVAPRVIFQLNVPKVRTLTFCLPFDFVKARKHIFDGEHYWELNKKGYNLEKVIYDLTFQRGVALEKTYRVAENPYHRFFVLKVL